MQSIYSTQPVCWDQAQYCGHGRWHNTMGSILASCCHLSTGHGDVHAGVNGHCWRSLYSRRDQPVIVNWTLRLKLQLEINYYIFTQNKCSISSHILGSVFTPTLSRTQNVMMARWSNCTDNHSLPKQARMSGDNFQPNKQICSLVTGSLWETFRNKFNWSSDNAMSQVNDVPSHIWSLFIQMFSY